MIQAALLGGGGNRKLSYQIRVGYFIAVRWRRRDGVAVGRLIFTFVAGVQPGTGLGVGGKALWAAFAAPPRAEPACGRG